jgi:hypothetical protein
MNFLSILTVRRSLLVYPDKQTCSKSVGMPQRCHEETHAPQQFSLLFNHLNSVKSKRAMKLPEKEYVAGFPAAHVFPRGAKCL